MIDLNELTYTQQLILLSELLDKVDSNMLVSSQSLADAVNNLTLGNLEDFVSYLDEDTLETILNIYQHYD